MAGGSAGLLITDEGGVATLIRSGLADLAGVQPSNVILTAVKTVTTLANSSSLGLANNATVYLNSTSLANANTTSSNASSIYGLGSVVRRLGSSGRHLATSIANSSACNAARSAGPANATMLIISIAIDAAGLSFVNGSDPASVVAARVAAAFANITTRNSSNILADFASAWSNCTGAPSSIASLVSLVSLPCVIWLAPSAAPRPTAEVDSGLSEGGIAAAIVVPLLLVLICCFYGLVAVRRRYRKDQQQPKDVQGTSSMVPMDFLRENPMLVLAPAAAGPAVVDDASASADDTSFNSSNPMRAHAQPSTRTAFTPMAAAQSNEPAIAVPKTKAILKLRKTEVLVTASVAEALP